MRLGQTSRICSFTAGINMASMQLHGLHCSLLQIRLRVATSGAEYILTDVVLRPHHTQHPQQQATSLEARKLGHRLQQRLIMRRLTVVHMHERRLVFIDRRRRCPTSRIKKLSIRYGQQRRRHAVSAYIKAAAPAAVVVIDRRTSFTLSSHSMPYTQQLFACKI